MKNIIPVIGDRIHQLQELAKTKKKKTAFLIEFPSSPEDRDVTVPKLRETASLLIGFCKVTDVAFFREILQMAEGKVDYLALDMDKKIPGLQESYDQALAALKKTKLFVYNENTAWCDSLVAFLAQVHPPSKSSKILLKGTGNLAYRLALDLVSLSYQVTFELSAGDDQDTVKNVVTALNAMKNSFEKSEIRLLKPADAKKEKFDILIGAQPKTQVITPETMEQMSDTATILDGGIGTLSPEAVTAALKRNLHVYRVDNRAAVAALLQRVLETEDLVKNRMGRQIIAKVPVVAGGVMGQKGDVIVDSASNPKIIIGVADGAGRVRDPMTDEEHGNVKKIQNLIKM